MRSLVTGGKGFIGSHLVNKLVELGDEVTVIDYADLLDYPDPSKNVRYYETDLNDFTKILPIFDGMHRVFHMAADVSIPQCIKFPKECGSNNANTTLNVLECCRIHNIKKIVFSSTSAVYKDKFTSHNYVRYNEWDQTLPLNIYSATKLYGESLCKIYASLYKLEPTILRYFNVYGKNDRSSAYAAVVRRFLDCKSIGNPLTIFGDGLQTRDFVHVNDIVYANLMVSEKEQEHYGEIFNIGTGYATTIQELAHMISNNVDYFPANEGELRHSCADIRKLYTEFNWYPTKTINDYLKNLNG